jgi:isoleucyl-tRNA synthetase
LKNGVPFGFAVALTGADPMRWTFCGNPLNKDIRFGIDPRVWPRAAELKPSDDSLAWDAEFQPQFDPNKPPGDPIYESTRRLLTLWNVASFFVTYANLDSPDLSAPPSPEKHSR